MRSDANSKQRQRAPSPSAVSSSSARRTDKRWITCSSTRHSAIFWGGLKRDPLKEGEARRGAPQKRVPKSPAPPTFDVLIEIINRNRFAVHLDIMASVDALLRGYPFLPEVRTRDEKGRIQIEKAAPAPTSRMDAKETKTPRRGRQPASSSAIIPPSEETSQRLDKLSAVSAPRFEPVRGPMQTVRSE